ncbi:hypothetical protein ACFWHR_07610 [Leucobacter sp. NPDC058333]|uniref:hypothetical protein n=1 Tax=Leucobacter sp. NPDC058333 TaxID=3346450 RepID=UPI00364C2847
MDTLAVLGLIIGPGGIIALVIAFFRDRRTARSTEASNQNTAIGERWDDVVGLSEKMQAFIAAEVEKQVAPFKKELAEVKAESHDMNTAFRSYAVQSWMWDNRGRLGDMPMLPLPILHRLGIGHLATDEDLEDTIRIPKETP